MQQVLVVEQSTQIQSSLMKISIMSEEDIIFEQNSAAEDGGGIDSTGAIVTTAGLRIHFIANSAGKNGGGLSMKRHRWNKPHSPSIPANFTQNTAGACGGAAYVEVDMEFVNITAIFNSGSALCISEESKVKFLGQTNISFNTGRMGGGLTVPSGKSAVSFFDYIVFDSNRATIGGAIYSLYETTITFSHSASFAYNLADEDGGALYVLGTKIIFETCEKCYMFLNILAQFSRERRCSLFGQCFILDIWNKQSTI